MLSRLLTLSCLAAAFSLHLFAQVPTPQSVLGHTPGDDFYLANYDEALTYMRKLEASSKRIKLVKAGKTTRGLDWYFAVISSEANLTKLTRYKEIAGQLARVGTLTDDSARALAKEGKAIIHIDSGLHATEAAPAQHAINLAYHLVSAQGNPEIDNILDNVVLVLWFSINPDGQNQMVSWYRRNLGTPYEVAPMVELYQEYIGHDNNRDGYMNNMVESQVITRSTLEWNPVVFYNHHQSAPFPTRIWIPPFAEPISDNVNPRMFRWVNVFGTSMAAYLDDHGMPGAIHRGVGFDDWYPGFVDHVNSFRNTVSFLTETALFSYATPKFYTLSDFPQDRKSLKAEVLYSSPWKGGWWRLRDAVDYCEAASMGVLNVAAKNREQLLFNRYQAGRENIKNFTDNPPYAYVIPSEQFDSSEAAALVDKLLVNGIEVRQATQAMTLEGNTYPAGSWVVMMNQPYSALVKELFERQKYPDLREYPGGPPDLPYDVAGWTLPLQMNVSVDALSTPVPANMVPSLKVVTKASLLNNGPVGGGLAVSWNNNGAALVANAALKSKATVMLNRKDATLVITGGDRASIEAAAVSHNVTFRSANANNGVTLKSKRVGLYRPWLASIDEGWTRWLLENYQFDLVALRDQDMRNGKLDRRIDVLIIPDMRPNSIVNGNAPGTVPDAYTGGIGPEGIESIRQFVHGGGTLVAFNGSSMFAIDELQLPVKNVVNGVPSKEFFCSGSLLSVQAAGDHPVLTGMPAAFDVMFERSPVFEISDAGKAKALASYPSDRNPLDSGFLLGDQKLRGKAALVDVTYGKGHVVLFGFRPQWRGQSRGTYKLIFNSIFMTPDWASTAPTPTAEIKEKKL